MNQINSNIISNIIPKTENAYIVGGCVRDLLLGLSPVDYDIAVSGDSKQFAKDIASKISGKIIHIGKPGQTILRVVSGDKIFDISSTNNASIKDDLNKRDFTVNAIAYSLSSNKIIDPLGGVHDLENKKIRMVSHRAFIKDPIRMIRAYRLSASLGFKIDNKTVSAIKENADLIKNSAGERINAEFFKILKSTKSFQYVSQMSESGLLLKIFPELQELKGCAQNKYHAYDVFEHTMRAFDCLEKILNDCSEYIEKTYRRNIKQLDKKYILKFAVLLHDIGKPDALTLDAQGNIHFYGHAQKGANKANRISRRLKLSNADRYYTNFIISNHIRPLFLFISYQKKILTKKGMARFFIKYGNNTPALLLHTIADIQGKGNKENARDAAFIEFAKNMLHDFFSDFMTIKTKPLLITGNDLINELGLTPSPLFKKILKIVQEERLSNKISTRQEALMLAKEVLRDQL